MEQVNGLRSKEGPTMINIKSTTDRANNKFDFSFTNEDYWFTAKDNYVYVISLTNPDSKTVSVKALYDSSKSIKSIKVLGNTKSLKWKASGNKLDITLPKKRKTDIIGFVLKVELE